MAETKEEAKEETVEVEPKPVAGREPEEKPQATEEELERLRTELQEKDTKLQSADGRWQTAQGIINELKGKVQALEDNQELWKMLVGMNAENRGISEEASEQELQKNKPNLIQTADYLEKSLEAKRFKRKYDSYGPVVEELGLKPGDDDYEVIRSFAATGQWGKADKKIAALKASKTEQPKSEKGKAVESELPEEEEEKIAKKYLQKKGLLKSEGGEPSAGGGQTFTRQQIENMSTADYAKNKEAIDAALRAGRVK